MKNCLLCQEPHETSITLLDLLLLQPIHTWICSNCERLFKRIDEPHCQRCNKSGVQGICKDCKQWEKREYVVCHQSLYAYSESMSQYFERYKFWGDLLLCHVFSKEIHSHLKKEKNYTIVPIPVSDERRMERGFNQVEELLKAARIPFTDLLKKEERQHQAHLSRKKRLELDQPFQLKEVILPRKILLVDDVYTTGTTLYHAQRVLKEAGVQNIKTFSLAR